MGSVSSIELTGREILDFPEINTNSSEEKIIDLAKKIEELGTLLNSIRSVQMTQNVVDLTRVAKQVIPATVRIEMMVTSNTLFSADPITEVCPAHGSGFLISPDGYIVTCQHVIRGAEKIKVIFGESRRSFFPRIIGSDPETDIALLKIEAEDLPYVCLADSDQVQVGESIILVGNPLGFKDLLTLGVVGNKASGLISAFEGTFTQRDGGIYADYINSDAVANGGNSGGPLFNTQGEVIGLCTRGGDGLGMHIASNTVHNVVNELMQNGHITRSWLGAKTFTISEEIASFLQLEDSLLDKIMIVDVLKDSPAMQAGLQKGDVVVAYNDQPITTEDKFFTDLATRIGPGSELKLSIIRAGEPMDIVVTLGSRLVNVTTPVDKLGIHIENLSDEKFYWCDLDSEIQGVLVSAVDVRFATGLRPADVITAIACGIGFAEKPVRNVDEFLEAIEGLGEQKNFFLVVRSPDRSRPAYYSASL